MYNTSLPILATHLEWVSTALAMQTLDIDVHCQKWALTLQGLMVAAKEDGVDTRTVYVQLAMDTLEIENASVWDLFCSLP